MKIEKAGWIAVAVLAGALVTAGFENQAVKNGIVDVEKVFNESTFAKNQSESLRKMGTDRQSVLEFVNQYRTMLGADAEKFKDLTIKTTALSPAEKTELERIKVDAKTSEDAYRAAITQASPSPELLKKIEDWNRRKDATGDLLQTWQQEFTQEVQTKQASLRSEALVKVRQAIQKVARDQGYSMVFDSNVAPYAANDLTDEALKVMNGK
ncbi:MAG: OmpH family outer membrane protein [Fimbriimonas sp.]